MTREEALAREEGPFFMGVPERWLDDPTWRCASGHVSKRYLKSEATGRDLCLACRAPVRLTFPEDREIVGPRSMRPAFRLDEYAHAETQAMFRGREVHAYIATLGSLRPRLRWAARRPRALRLLKRLRLWHPPTAVSA